MRSRIEVVLVGVAVLVGAAAQVRAATIWNEAISAQGDLSNNSGAPTLLPLLPGDNNVIGTVGGGDLDFVRIVIPPAGQLTGLRLESYTGSDALAFIGIQRGVTITPTNDPATLLGYTHFGLIGSATAGTNILDDIGSGPGSQGFVPPLGPGDYSFWIQQVGGATGYNLNFQMALIPEPSGLALIAGALACVARFGRRRR